MKEHRTLYSRTVTGALQVWWVEQVGSQYRMVYGQQGGATVRTKWTQAEQTNAGRANYRNPVAQATAEIEAMYIKQLKSGYHESAGEVDRKTFFEPMLAKHYEEYKDSINWSRGVGVQIKFNGGRIIAKKEGLFTRRGERYISIPHIENALKGLFQRYPDAVLDGEGFNFELRDKLNELMSILRKTKNLTAEDLEKSRRVVEFHVYDGFLDEDSSKVGYLIRKSEIDEAISQLNDSIQRVHTTWVTSEAELEEQYKSFLVDGHEGAIIRQNGERYVSGRSSQLLKYKPMQDAEFKVLDIETGTGNWSEVAKVITLRNESGKVFRASFKGTMEQAATCLKERKQIIGKQVTVNFFGYTGLGTPNFAQFDWNNYNKH